ncbi:hypothetical protein H920_06934 [Fukomys damarensis]|uniref:Uncharacterized protein n=1 Tax=Fukomys damarensis TaxID=885580 RepID=A0A091DNB4_FUKDA|nr:hypothetical protein H920_06934 [Fukomys damarensis]
MKNLCHQAEGSTLEPETDTHSKDQSSPDESSSAILRDTKVLSISSDENSLIQIRKTMHSKLLRENRKAQNFLCSSLFTAIGNNLPVHHPCADYTDSFQLGIIS